MKITALDKDQYKASYLIRDVDTTTINTLRRTIIEDVPVMAVDEINFVKNDSALYDEIVGHRLGLVPLKSDLKSYNIKEECKCKGKGCARCQTTLTIKAEGPGTVYAKDIKSKDPRIQPVYPDMPIVKLLKNQKLVLEMTASLGTGRQHSKYIPGLAYYRNDPIIKIKDSKAVRGKDVCPTHVFKVEGGKIRVADERKCILCNACVDATDDKIIVSSSENDYIFNLESWGQLTNKEIMSKALDILDEKLKEFGTKIAKIKN